MKKILTIAIAVMMIAVMSVSVFAAEKTDTITVDFDTAVEGTHFTVAGLKDGLQVKSADGVTQQQYGVKPSGAAADAYIATTINVPADGASVRVDVKYSTNTDTNRWFAVKLDDHGEQMFGGEASGSWVATLVATTSYTDVAKGEHVVKLCPTSDFGSEAHAKAANILEYTITITYNEEETTTAAPDDTTTAAPDDTTAAPDDTTVAPDDTTTAPDNTPDTTPDEEDKAPQTGIVTAILVAAAAFSSAYIVSKKH